MKIRTRKETARIIAKTIKSIRSHAVITNELIKAECLKNNISERTIRIIAKGKDTKITPLKNNEDC